MRGLLPGTKRSTVARVTSSRDSGATGQPAAWERLVAEFLRDVETRAHAGRGAWVAAKLRARAQCGHPLVNLRIVWAIHKLSAQPTLPAAVSLALLPVLEELRVDTTSCRELLPPAEARALHTLALAYAAFVDLRCRLIGETLAPWVDAAWRLRESRRSEAAAARRYDAWPLRPGGAPAAVAALLAALSLADCFLRQLIDAGLSSRTFDAVALALKECVEDAPRLYALIVNLAQSCLVAGGDAAAAGGGGFASGLAAAAGGGGAGAGADWRSWQSSLRAFADTFSTALEFCRALSSRFTFLGASVPFATDVFLRFEQHAATLFDGVAAVKGDGGGVANGGRALPPPSPSLSPSLGPLRLLSAGGAKVGDGAGGASGVGGAFGECTASTTSSLPELQPVTPFAASGGGAGGSGWGGGGGWGSAAGAAAGGAVNAANGFAEANSPSAPRGATGSITDFSTASNSQSFPTPPGARESGSAGGDGFGTTGRPDGWAGRGGRGGSSDASTRTAGATAAGHAGTPGAAAPAGASAAAPAAAAAGGGGAGSAFSSEAWRGDMLSTGNAAAHSMLQRAIADREAILQPAAPLSRQPPCSPPTAAQPRQLPSRDSAPDAGAAYSSAHFGLTTASWAPPAAPAPLQTTKLRVRSASRCSNLDQQSGGREASPSGGAALSGRSFAASSGGAEFETPAFEAAQRGEQSFSLMQHSRSLPPPPAAAQAAVAAPAPPPPPAPPASPPRAAFPRPSPATPPPSPAFQPTSAAFPSPPLPSPAFPPSAPASPSHRAAPAAPPWHSAFSGAEPGTPASPARLRKSATDFHAGGAATGRPHRSLAESAVLRPAGPREAPAAAARNPRVAAVWQQIAARERSLSPGARSGGALDPPTPAARKGRPDAARAADAAREAAAAGGVFPNPWGAVARAPSPLPPPPAAAPAAGAAGHGEGGVTARSAGAGRPHRHRHRSENCARKKERRGAAGGAARAGAGGGVAGAGAGVAGAGTGGAGTGPSRCLMAVPTRNEALPRALGVVQVKGESWGGPMRGYVVDAGAAPKAAPAPGKAYRATVPPGGGRKPRGCPIGASPAAVPAAADPQFLAQLRASLPPHYIISETAVVKEKLVGRGSTASVFKGWWQRTTPVAVKEFHFPHGLESASGRARIREFYRELSAFLRLHHPNLIRIFGVIPAPLGLVTEFCAGGTLFETLHARKHPAARLSWPQKLKICRDVAAGVVCLHTADPPAIHRDLKSLNILLDQPIVNSEMEPLAKIADFGLTRIRGGSVWGALTGAAGTFQWMAPEVIRGSSYDEKADIFSFGILLFEILSGEIPYKKLGAKGGVSVVLKVAQGERPDVSRIAADQCPAELLALMAACWSAAPPKRPSAVEVLHRLNRFAPLPR